jgi:hypothetical protein
MGNVLLGRLVDFAAFKKHIGFYPASMTMFTEFRDELKPYKTSGKGTIRIQFPCEDALPLDLIERIIAFRKSENVIFQEGIFEAAQTQAVKEVVAWQLSEAMKKKENLQEQDGCTAQNEPYAGRPAARSEKKTTSPFPACSGRRRWLAAAF